MINKYYSLHYVGVIVICIALLVVGAFYDYEIAAYLFDSNNFFGVVFESYAHLIGFLFIPVWGCCTIRYNNRKLFNMIFGFVLLFGSFIVFNYIATKNMIEHGYYDRFDPYVLGIISGLCSSVLFLLMSQIDKETIKKIKALCGFSLLFLALKSALIYPIKYICGRDRYDDIFKNSVDYVFANWYNPDFFSSGTSFPSGHVASAAGILVLLILPFVFVGLKKYKNLFFAISYGYMVFMAISRMIIGRHYLSDTVFAILLCTLVFIFVTSLFEKYFKKMLIK